MHRSQALKRFFGELSRFCQNYGQLQNMPVNFIRCFSTGSQSRINRNSFFMSSTSNRMPRFVPNDIPLPTYIKDNLYGVPSMPEIKSKEEIDNMRPACKLAAQILDNVEQNLWEGMTTDDIDALVHRLCIEKGAYPSPLLYKGFPKSVCTSVNQVACHGIPGSLVIQDGDIITVDVTVFYKGFHGDTSRTFHIGQVGEMSANLVTAAKLCRDVGIEVCRHGAYLSDIGEAIYSCAVDAGFQIIPNFCGHGIGTYFHGPPDIIHVPYEDAGDEKMQAGMTFTIEPILCQGSPDIKILEDGWTVVTVDGSRSAQFEHTVLVTHDGCEILTQ